ncbi:MAG: hypothetical protein LBQ60_02915 [Bacteroidales bacterium]|jgi:hypothetical protein|nr:hypothetical protein [Bacteroidales bacterium]
MENSEIQKKQNQSDEIDIFEFCSRVWSAFVSFLIQIGNFFLSIIIFIIRKLGWIVSFAALGAIAGILYYVLTPTVYSSVLEARTGDVDNSVVIDHINKLAATNGKPKILANFIGITEEDARKVVSIKAYYGIDYNKSGVIEADYDETYNPRDTNQVRVPSYLFLKASVLDEDIFPMLREHIMKYIKTNQYINRSHELSQAQKKSYISELEVEIQKIDDLQRFQYKQNPFSNSTKEYFLIKPEAKLFHEDLLALYNKKQGLERDLEMYNEDVMIIVQDFTPLSQEEQPMTSRALKWGLIGAGLGLVCAVIWQFRKKIWTLIKENPANN